MVGVQSAVKWKMQSLNKHQELCEIDSEIWLNDAEL